MACCEALQQAAAKPGLFASVLHAASCYYKSACCLILNSLGCYGKLNVETLRQFILYSRAKTDTSRTTQLAAGAPKHRAKPGGPPQRSTRRSHGRLRINTNESRAEAQAVDGPSLRLRFSSFIDVRAGDDVVRVDHLRGPVLRSLRSGVGQTRPLLVGRASIVLREVEHDAVRRRAGPRCGINISFKYG